jgi:hypothetical protein
VNDALTSLSLNSKQTTLLSRITSRLLNLRSGTPVGHTRKDFGEDRTLIDEMVKKKLIRVVGGQYLPTYRGIQQLDEDIRRVVRESLNWVLHALKRMYSRSEGDVFTFEAIVREARSVWSALDANDALPALILGEGQEFNYYYFPSGILERGAGPLAVQVVSPLSGS